MYVKIYNLDKSAANKNYSLSMAAVAGSSAAEQKGQPHFAHMSGWTECPVAIFPRVGCIKEEEGFIILYGINGSILYEVAKTGFSAMEVF